jgi:hypothetical protein
MNISDKIICIAVQPVIEVVPALVGTEFLVGATSNNFTAIETFFFHGAKVLLKIKKNVFKRV